MQPCDYKSPALTEEVSRNLRQSHADGVIVTPPLSDMKTLKALLEEQNMPFVRIAPAEHADDRRSVYTNDRESCAKMTEQLARARARRASASSSAIRITLRSRTASKVIATACASAGSRSTGS